MATAFSGQGHHAPQIPNEVRRRKVRRLRIHPGAAISFKMMPRRHTSTKSPRAGCCGRSTVRRLRRNRTGKTECKGVAASDSSAANPGPPLHFSLHLGAKVPPKSATIDDAVRLTPPLTGHHQRRNTTAVLGQRGGSSFQGGRLHFQATPMPS
jgi:hypothetical protein